MLEYSDLFKREYDSDNVRYIPNMLQNYKYMTHPLAKNHLVDIICGNENKLVFVWEKCSDMDQLYRLWCDRKL